MNYLDVSALATVGQPLFGNQWLALLAVLAGTAVLMFAIVVMGKFLAMTHPSTGAARAPVFAASAEAPSSVAPVPSDTIAPEVQAVIAASVYASFGGNARIAAAYVMPEKPVNIEVLMAQWAIEGRRQIYSSHRVR